jgi:F-type H+-transporting ATPase subunit b
VDERKQYIDHSLIVAKEANEQLANIKAEGESILAKANEEQVRILKEAAEARERIVREAKEQARIEGKSATISGAQSDEALPTAKKST